MIFKPNKERRSKQVQQHINGIVCKLTEEYTDTEISQIVNSIREQSLEFLKHRQNTLEKKLYVNSEAVNAIK